MANEPTPEERKKKRKEMDVNNDGVISDAERKAWKASQEVTPDPLSKSELATQYGYALEVIYANPELRKLFERALNADKGQWSTDKFLAELKNTQWWSHGKYWREAWVSEKEGSEWKNDVSSALEVVQRRATALGATLSDQQARRLARRYLYEGWYDGPRSTMLDNALAEFIGSSSVGETDYRSRLQTLAYDYGVDKLLNDSWYETALQRIARGDTTYDSLTADIKNMAKSKYATLSGAIDSGETTRSALKGYTGSMAQLLEVDESRIDLEDPLMKQAYASMLGPDGKPSMMTLFDFETQVRKDARWKNTRNGRQTTVNAAQSFLQSLGFVGGN